MLIRRQHPGAELRQRSIDGKQEAAAFPCLGVEQAIERVAVPLAQLARQQDSCKRDRHRTESVAQRLLDDASRLQTDLALAPLEPQFPDRSFGKPYAVGARNRAPRLLAEFGRVGERPNQTMRIEQQIHEASKASSRLGAKKSRESRSRVLRSPPSRTPLRLALAGVATGVRRARGFPARAITTVSPAIARSRSAESWALA